MSVYDIINARGLVALAGRKELSLFRTLKKLEEGGIVVASAAVSMDGPEVR